MESSPLNIYIVADHALVVNGLKNKLVKRFGDAVAVTAFYDLQECLKKVDGTIEVLIADAQVEGKDLPSIAKKVRAMSPCTEVLIHDTPENVESWVASHLRARLVPEAAALLAVAS